MPYLESLSELVRCLLVAMMTTNTTMTMSFNVLFFAFPSAFYNTKILRNREQ
jgi:hypothetical protein